MKTALLPATRVSPALRRRLEGLLEEGETVSAFIESAVRRQAELREAERAFIERGLVAEQQGEWVTPEQVVRAVRAAGRRR